MPRQPDPFTRPLTGWSEPLHRYDRHRLLIRSRLPRLSGTVVVSHVSAAVLHRLPLPLVVLTTVHVTRPERRSARQSPVLYTHGASLRSDEIVMVDGMAVTSPTRTIMDCARSLPFEATVELMDTALARGLVTTTELSEAAARPRLPGAARIRAAATWADPGSRTVSDSRNRLAFAGLVASPPRAHVLVPFGPAGLPACADVWFPDEQVVGVVEDGPDPQGPPCPVTRLTADRCRSADHRFISWFRAELDEPMVLDRRWRELVGSSPHPGRAWSGQVSAEQA